MSTYSCIFFVAGVAMMTARSCIAFSTSERQRCGNGNLDETTNLLPLVVALLLS
jgi:hypothetical protein